ncbi:MAG: VWA domain-containing protein [Tepidisphaeraceae bacterium]
MKYFYGEFDGEEFPTQDKLFGLDQFMDFLLQYGDRALDAMKDALNDPDNKVSEMLEQLLKDGMLDKDGKGKLKLTPRAVNRMQIKALSEIFRNLRNGQRDGHEKTTAGPGAERLDGTKPYEFGDPLSEIDLNATLKNAIARAASSEQWAVGSSNASPLPPTAHRPLPTLQERDFELHLREGTTSCSTVVLLDLSGSMMRYQRYLNSKKVALALLALVRQRFPMDTVDFVGFYSGATKIPETALPIVMPKPVTIYDYQVRLKVKANDLDKAPQHFTNLHMGLQMARRILRKRSGENKQVFIITDGQPTAHVEGDWVYLLYPPDQRSTVATLKEAALCMRDGVRLSTFALIEDYYGMDWVGFVDQLTKLTKGVAFYTSSGELANCVMESYLTGRKKKSFIA